MKTSTIFFIVLCFSFEIIAQTCPSSVRVGSSCGTGTSCSPCSTTNCCHNCTGTVDVVTFETYVKRVLAAEWINCWGSQTGGMNSLQAGAVAIRSYSISRIANLASCHGANYDICRTTCCQAYSATQYTNSNNAVDNTANYVLVSGSTIQLAEFSAENNDNNNPNSSCGNCNSGGNGWPCISDPVCCGQTFNGHGGGMCQNGSARWATGLNLVNSSCTWQSAHSYGTKTWQQILSLYYPNWTLTTCSTTSCVPPNNDCSGATTLTPSTSCSYQSYSSTCATQSIAAISPCNGFTNGNADDDVWFKFSATSGTTYTVNLLNGTSFDGVIDLRQGSCNGTSIDCDDQTGSTGILSTVSVTPSSNQTYYVRVYHYGSGAGGGSFQICVVSSNTTYPDLRVQDLYTSPSNPTVGEDVDLCAIIENIGTGNASNTVSWEYFINGGSVGSDSHSSGISANGGTRDECESNYVFTSAGNYQFCVYIDAYSGDNNSSNDFRCETITVTCPSLSQPGSINTPSTHCAGQTETYSISSVAGADSYVWQCPSGWSGCSSCSGTNCNITAGSGTGNICVTAQNNCGNTSTQRCQSVSPSPAPSQPSTISGSTNPCIGSTRTYSVTQVSSVNYSWSVPSGWSNLTGQGTSSITVTVGSGSGQLCVTPSNNCGNGTQRCTTVSPTTSQMNVSVLTTNATCTGSNGTATANASNGTSPYSYTWNPNVGTTQTISGLSPGTYNVTVTDATGCSKSSSGTVGSTNITLSVSTTSTSANTSCSAPNGSATVSASGGTPSYSFAWSVGGTGATKNNLAGGNYTVTATDANGCTGTGTVTIGQTTPNITIQVQSTTPTTSCSAPNGAATVSATGGAGSYSYSWSGGQTGATANGLAAGSHTVTATDANNCIGTGTVTIGQNTPTITIQTQSTTPTTSCSAPNGAATVSATGGAGSYSYSWSGGQTGATATGLAAGSHTVTAMDANSCTGTSTVTIGQTTPTITVQIQSTSPSTSCTAPNGSATVSASGGTGAYTYQWSNGQTGNTPIGLAADTYSVTATDANGCTGTTSVTINSNTPVVVTAVQVNPATCLAHDGSVQASATGGTAPYTYSWSNSMTGDLVNGLASGNYSVTAQDANQCTGTGNVTINSVSNVTGVSLSASSNSICTGTSATLTVIGGTTHSWNNGDTTNSISVSPLLTNSYSVTATDANGCDTVMSVTVIVNLPVAPTTTFDFGSIDVQNRTYCFNNNSTNATRYKWDFGDGDSSTLKNVCHTYAADIAIAVVTLTAYNECGVNVDSSKYQRILYLPTGINEVLNGANVKVYPNPNSGEFIIQLNLTKMLVVSYKVHDVTGKEILSSKPETLTGEIKRQVNLGPASAGIYFLTLFAGDDLFVRKLIVE